MTDKPPKDVYSEFEKALADKKTTHYVLRIYVAGTTTRSVQAISNVQQICEEYLQGRYELEVIDTSQKPGMAKEDHLRAMPTLIKKLPTPLRRFIGNLSDKERILVGLDLIEKNQPDEPYGNY